MGNASDLDALVNGLLPRLYTTAHWMARPPIRPEDAVQETLMHFIRSHRQDPARIRDPLGWCLSVLIRECRRRPRESSLPTGDILSPAADPAQEAADRERDRILHEALAGLPDDERDPIGLHVFGGMTIRQASEALGVPSATVHHRHPRRI